VSCSDYLAGESAVQTRRQPTGHDVEHPTEITAFSTRRLELRHRQGLMSHHEPRLRL